MAGMILKPLVEKLIEKLAEEIIGSAFRYLKYQFRWQEHAKEELEKLIETLPQIEAVVHFASSQEQFADQNRALNKWLWQLRDAIDDAYDVLDDMEYIKLEKQVTKNKKLRRKRSIVKSGLVKIGERVFNNDPTLKRLEKAVQNLLQVSTRVDTFYHLAKDAKKELEKQQLELHEARESGALPKNVLIGRVQEKELVMEWLTNPSNDETWGTDLRYKNISLLSIVGHGGMGKTTLLQHVYEDEMAAQGFDLKMWVCVSNNFDAKKVIADALQSLKMERPSCDTLDALQNRLRTDIKSKKFLLVLDDIWEEDEEEDKRKWEDVLAPLIYGGFGSKILVTTRMASVALMFAKVITKKEKIVKLNGLEEHECLQLLNSHAFFGVKPDDYEKLRAIAGEIVKKLSRSPLAAKVIGGVLNNNLDERHWMTVLKSNLLDQNSITSILTLSYMVLPNHLRNCFAICCMFPKDHAYDKDDLVRMWIALGFIHPSQGMTTEDIGERYFDLLVKKNLFDKVGDDYKMHDLIHESASKFFAHECGKFLDDHEKSSVEISGTIRHLCVQTINPNVLSQIGKFKHLHSVFLIFQHGYYNQNFGSSLIEIFKAAKSLRVLYIRIDNLKNIPKEIKYLKHLRYLVVKRSFLTRLPRSVSNLYHMQYMILDRRSDNAGNDFLPSSIYNLSNLRYMELPKNFIASICGIGKLKYLQELHKFCLKNEDGYRIWELENMNDLCNLGIYCLENVKDAKEASSGKLYAKKRLTDLILDWSNTNSMGNINLHENVFDNLQPPKCLRNLTVQSYMGARSAKWMNDVNLISNLEKIVLSKCSEWETLPSFGQLLFLKSLELNGMPKVKYLESKFNGNDIYGAFPLLEKLYFKDLEALEDWFMGGVASEDGCLFPCLIELELENCPKLKELPSLPPKLKTLKIVDVGWRTLNFCSNSNPIHLETLAVSRCPNITYIPLADEIARLAALRYLEITGCPNLISLGEMATATNNCHHLMLSNLTISDPSVLLMEPLRSITSLKKLTIQYNDEVVVSFPNEAEQWFLNVNVSSSLSELKFEYLGSLQSLPSSLECLLSLQELSIRCVCMLRELPNLPPSLKSLTIIDVLMLRELPNLPPSLKELLIYNVPMLGELLNLPPSLEGLFIDDVPMLRELPNLPPSLEALSIENLPMFRELPNLPPSLQCLSIEGLPMLRELSNLPLSLKTLHITDVPMLRKLPNLPPSFQYLTISGECNPELKKRYREDGGSDCHMIDHIPYFYIDT